MTIYIPILLLYIPLFIALWLMVGWVWRTLAFIIYPGMVLGLDRRERRRMLYWGPLGIYMHFQLYMGMLEAKRIRAEMSARKEPPHP